MAVIVSWKTHGNPVGSAKDAAGLPFDEGYVIPIRR